MRIDNIEVEYFKFIEKLSLNLNSRNCLIYGENGSGKSSVFEFLINEITEKKNYVCVVYNKEKKKIRFTTNNKSIYQKNLHYGYIQNKVIRKYFGYINISPHENTIKHEKINKGFDFSMASDKFRASEFDKYLEESKNELIENYL